MAVTGGAGGTGHGRLSGTAASAALPVRRNFVFRDPPFLKAPKSALREAYLARRLDALDAIIAGRTGSRARTLHHQGRARLRRHASATRRWEFAYPEEKGLAEGVAQGRAEPEEAAFGLAFADEEAAATFRERAERLFGRFDEVG